MSDEDGPDEKLLAVPATDPRWDGIQDLAYLDHYLLSEISHFFEVYKALEPGKGSLVCGWRDRTAAEAELQRAYSRARIGVVRPYPPMPVCRALSSGVCGWQAFA